MIARPCVAERVLFASNLVGCRAEVLLEGLGGVLACEYRHVRGLGPYLPIVVK